jgi:transcriptional regulator with XRE-family HTH domain
LRPLADVRHRVPVTDERPADRLARLVRERRIALGLTQADVANLGGLSVSSQQRLERGATDGAMRDQTAAAIERGLSWASGSVRAILRGDDPSATPGAVERVMNSQGEPVVITVDISEPLTAQERRELMAAAEAEVLKRWREIRRND